MLYVRSASIIFLMAVALGAPSSRAGISCAPGDAAARALTQFRFDVVPCANEKGSRPPTDGKASGPLAKDVDALIDWLAARTGWTVRDAPPVKFVSHERLAAMFGETADGVHVEALYSSRDHSIYLPEGWKADELRRRSILLHELVHHLQYVNRVKAICASEQELQAFTLQIAWLKEQGVEDPLALLGVDPLLFLMLGHCDEMAQ